jgi:hypothetical protein
MTSLIIISLASSFTVFIFGFWIGRCARRLPIIDDNLPWTMYRERASRCSSHCLALRGGVVRGEAEPASCCSLKDDRDEPRW